MSPAQPGKPGEVDLSGVADAGQLAALLRRLRLRAGNPALREIERLGRNHGRALSRSTVAGVLAGQRKPRRDVLLALIEVFGVPRDAVPGWIAAWERVMAGESADSGGRIPAEAGGKSTPGDSPGENGGASDIWHFPSEEAVTVTCARLPDHLRRKMPYVDPRDPDYVELFSYVDPDALLHLYGHLRALNPALEVRLSTTDELNSADYANHLVVLGGTDFNVLTRDMFSTLQLPVRMPLRATNADTSDIEVVDGDEVRKFSPLLDDDYGSRILHEDVILFFRGVNPVNRRRTITICAGMFARGTLAAVQCLTDPVLGPANQDYLRRKFAPNRHFGFVARAFVINGVVAPPDLAIPEHRLYEWARPE